MTFKFDGWPNRALLLYYIKFVHHFKPIGEFKLELQSGNSQFGSKSINFLVLRDLEIWWMTMINNRARLLYYVKPWLYIISKPWVNWNWSYSPKRSIPVKISEFLSRVTLKFDWWPWQTIGYLFYKTPSLVHHFKDIGEFKLELQSGNTQFASKSAIFFVLCDLEIWWMTMKNNRVPLPYYVKHWLYSISKPWVNWNWSYSPKRSISVKISEFLSRVTLKFDWWPSIGYLFYRTSSFVHHFKAIGEFKLELQSGNTQFASKSAIFLSCVNLKFDGWSWKTIRHLFYAASSLMHHFIAISEFNFSYSPETPKFGSKSAIFCPVWPWNLTHDLEK